ncbi:ABC transporter ATP-binding protein [Salinibacterium sp.]|uniref:ABC transporter ATP-binding protein n=1 Tax=Salinibacterium sp. TaxID=1915057 RepID=UPI00286C4389|nr:ABC transporter ATP-binding protein [Salinibacterium sp.]
MASTSIVTVDNVSKKFVLNKHKSIKERLVNARSQQKHLNEFWALRDIDLDIKAGSTVGLVGHNGSGKSTLLKIVGGIIEPSSGIVLRRGRMAALLELGAGFHPDLTGRENVFLNAAILGLTQKETERHLDAIVDFSGIESFIDTQVKFFSSGMYVRLAFAVAVHVDPDLLLVDEVLAVGDEPFQNKCIAKITEFQKEGRTIVVVSHAPAQIEALCDRVVVLSKGEMIFDGNTMEGIDVLQRGYAEQQVSEAELQRTVGLPSAMVRNVLIASGEAEEEKTVAVGDDMTVSYTYEVLRDERPLVAVLSIETARGAKVYELTTKMIGQELPRSIGHHTVEFTFNKPALGAGDYVVRGGLETIDSELVHQLKPASRFVVRSSLPGTGTLSMDLKTRIFSH